MSQDDHTYSEGDRVVYQITPNQTVDEDKLDDEGMLRCVGKIDTEPGYDTSFGGKPMRSETRYKIERSGGVYNHVPESQIIALLEQYTGELP